METLDQFYETGFTFTGPGYSSKSEKVIHFQPPYLGTVAKTVKLFAKLPEGFQDPEFEYNGLTYKHRFTCARIASAMATNSRFTSIQLIAYFLLRIEPEKLFRVTVMLYHLCDFPILQEVMVLLSIKK